MIAHILASAACVLVLAVALYLLPHLLWDVLTLPVDTPED